MSASIASISVRYSRSVTGTPADFSSCKNVTNLCGPLAALYDAPFPTGPSRVEFAPVIQPAPPRVQFRFTAAAVAVLLLLAPALWNGFPLLQYDTGGYLARWYEGHLVPSRSTVFGLFLHIGEGLHFWPEVLLQAGCTVWVISLVLRVFGLGGGPWRAAIVIAG